MWQTRRTSQYGLRAALVLIWMMLAMLVAANADDDAAQSKPASSDGQLSLLPESEPQLDLAADPLSGGVTAVASDQVSQPPTESQQPITVEPAAAQPPPAVSTAEAQPQTLTFSNRFLLGNRQDQLSLSADQPAGDNSPKPKPKPKTSPAKPKPANVAPKSAQPEPLPASSPPVSPEADQALPALPIGPVAPPNLDLSTEPAPASEEPSLAEYFAQGDPGTDSVLGAVADTPEVSSNQLTDTSQSAVPVSVIATRPPIKTRELQPSINTVLDGQEQSSVVGSGLSGFTPWRSFAIMLAMLAVLLGGVWVVRKWKLPKFGVNQGSLAVMEMITLSPGRQIVIVEMRDEALVLGMTPHSINLLDKVPLDDFGTSYRKTVDMIIRREDQAQPNDWARQPQFAAEPAIPRLADFKPGATYSPTGQLKTSVAELRRARASLSNPSGGLKSREPAMTRGSAGLSATKTELINRARQQLLRLGD